MKTVTFEILGRPCSKKNSRRIFGSGKFKKNLPSLAYERFAQDAKFQLMEIKPTLDIELPIPGPVEVSTSFRIKGKGSLDGDNAHTGLLDILQDAGIIKNDKNVMDGHYHKKFGYKDWRNVITITIL